MTATSLAIAFVNTLYPPHGSAGAETTLRLLVRQLAARGHRCTVVTLTPDRDEALGEVDGVPVRYLPLANVRWPHGLSRARLKPLFQAIEAYNPIMERRLRRHLREIAPDVVNAHNLQGFSASAWIAARRLRIPVVQTIHDYYTACPRSAMWRPGRGNCETLCAECRVFGAPRRALSNIPDAVTCVSHRVFDRLSAAGAFSPRRKSTQVVRIIRGNNQTDELPPLPPARDPNGPLRVGFIGRLDPSKGVETLLDAVARCAPGTVTLQVAGRGDAAYADSLRTRAHGDVAFLGHVDPATFFPTIDVLAIPSVWEDPFPRVFHEALAYGVPSLVTPQGGLPEVILPGRTGFIASGVGADAFHAALQALAGTDWSTVRDACRAAATDYGPSRIVGEYEAVLAATAAHRPLADGVGEGWRGARAAMAREGVR